MQTSFSTITLLSFYPWLDNWLLQRGQAYTNTVSRLYYQADPQIPGYVTYAAPFKSFVWDSGVSGAQIISSVSGSLGTINRGQSGMIVDFINGRVIFPSAVGTTALISGSYAFKDFNLYFANQTQERMVFANKYYLNSRFNRPITGMPPAYDIVTPCIFISNVHTDNQNWSFGGMYNTRMNITLNVLAENMSQLEGAMSLLTDAKNVCFPQLNTNTWPINNFGDYKSGYNYVGIQSQYGTASNLYTITDVRATKVGDYAKIDESIFLGLIDIVIEKPRLLR